MFYSSNPCSPFTRRCENFISVFESDCEVSFLRSTSLSPSQLRCNYRMASIRSIASTTRALLPSCPHRCFSSSSRSRSVHTPLTSRQIGKVPRPARPTPLPTGPPQRKYPKPLPLSLGHQTELLKSLAATPAIRARPTLINEESCRDLVRAWGVDRMKDVTVIDTYAGTLTNIPLTHE